MLAGKSYRRGKLSTVDLLVLTSLGQLVFILKLLFSFVTKYAALMRRSTVLSLPLQLVFLGFKMHLIPAPTSWRVSKCKVGLSVIGGLEYIVTSLSHFEFSI